MNINVFLVQHKNLGACACDMVYRLYQDDTWHFGLLIKITPITRSFVTNTYMYDSAHNTYSGVHYFEITK